MARSITRARCSARVGLLLQPRDFLVELVALGGQMAVAAGDDPSSSISARSFSRSASNWTTWHGLPSASRMRFREVSNSRSTSTSETRSSPAERL